MFAVAFLTEGNESTEHTPGRRAGGVTPGQLYKYKQNNSCNSNNVYITVLFPFLTTLICVQHTALAVFQLQLAVSTELSIWYKRSQLITIQSNLQAKYEISYLSR